MIRQIGYGDVTLKDATRYDRATAMAKCSRSSMERSCVINKAAQLRYPSGQASHPGSMHTQKLMRPTQPNDE